MQDLPLLELFERLRGTTISTDRSLSLAYKFSRKRVWLCWIRRLKKYLSFAVAKSS